MVLPYLQPINSKARKTQMQDKFLGLWNRENADPGQFVYLMNMSSDEFPYLSPHKKHRVIRFLADCKAIMGGEALSWVANGKLFFDGNEICDVTSDAPQLVRMGAYLIVWPDKIIYNTHTGELSSMDATKSYTGVTVRPCMLSGEEYTYTASDTAPANPAAGAYWYNTQTGGFYQYLGGEWQGIDTVYSRLEGPDLGKQFADYDVVSISGFSYPDCNVEAATVYGHGEDYIVIATGVFRDFEETQPVTISRTAPEMDFICENGNRLWGCSSEKHEIYGSKLGDPTNWHSFLGISTDSYAATVGSEGEFTGINAYMGYVHFWKENRCHRLYGTRPENFQLIELPIRGVKKGCHKSLCIVNGILYYVSRAGVMAFDGSTPVSVGEALGDVELENAVAGAHKNKVYLSAYVSRKGYYDMQEDALTYVMDTSRGLWHAEEGAYPGYASTPEGDFAYSWDNLWLLDGAGKTTKYDDPGYAMDQEDFWWRAETGDNGQDSPNQKWIKRLTYRVKMERGAKLYIDVMYNSDSNWQRALVYEAKSKRSVTLMMRAKRCDHFRLRYYGFGDVMVLSMAKSYEEGSERFV